MTDTTAEREVLPLYQLMNRIPGGLMLIPLVIGSLLGTFATGFLGARLVHHRAVPGQRAAAHRPADLRHRDPGHAQDERAGPRHHRVLLLCKSIIPASMVILLGQLVGIDGILGVSILALLVAVDNSNGGLWLAFTGRYGDKRDRGAYIASALNDGPFFSMLFLGASGLAEIPGSAPCSPRSSRSSSAWWSATSTRTGARCCVRRPPSSSPSSPWPSAPASTSTTSSRAALAGLVVGIIVAPITGLFVYLGYRFLLRRGYRSGIGFAAGTTAGNAIATPAIIGAGRPALRALRRGRDRAGRRLGAGHGDHRAAPRVRRAQARGRPAHRGGDRAASTTWSWASRNRSCEGPGPRRRPDRRRRHRACSSPGPAGPALLSPRGGWRGRSRRRTPWRSRSTRAATRAPSAVTARARRPTSPATGSTSRSTPPSAGRVAEQVQRCAVRLPRSTHPGCVRRRSARPTRRWAAPSRTASCSSHGVPVHESARVATRSPRSLESDLARARPGQRPGRDRRRPRRRHQRGRRRRTTWSLVDARDAGRPRPAGRGRRRSSAPTRCRSGSAGLATALARAWRDRRTGHARTPVVVPGGSRRPRRRVLAARGRSRRRWPPSRPTSGRPPRGSAASTLATCPSTCWSPLTGVRTVRRADVPATSPPRRPRPSARGRHGLLVLVGGDGAAADPARPRRHRHPRRRRPRRGRPARHRRRGPARRASPSPPRPAASATPPPSSTCIGAVRATQGA